MVMSSVGFKMEARLTMLLRNPFTPSFGVVPPYMAGREYLIEDLMQALDNGVGDPNLATIFVGARGTGKTTLLVYLAEQARAHGWISVSVAAMPGMLEDIYQRTCEAAEEFIDVSGSPKLKGVSIAQLFGVEWEPAQQAEANWRTRMNRLLKGLEKYDIGLLITIDEVRISLEEMQQFISNYQLFLGEKKRVALLMAGLPHQVSALLRVDSVTFFRRAAQHRLGNIPGYEVRDALAKTIRDGGRIISGEALDKMVEASGGFPYMMQLVGFRSWAQRPDSLEIRLEDVEDGIGLARKDMETRVLDATYRELSDGDLDFLRAMLSDYGESRMADIAVRMNVSSSYASQYRARLLEQGVIGERGRGKVGFDLPFFDEYLRTRLQEE